MLNFIKNFFRYKVKSIEEFTEVVKRENCRAVLIEPHLRFIADCQYVLNILGFTATTSRGRKIVYRERLKERFGSDRGFGDACNVAIRLGLLGEQKTKELQAKLPGVLVDLTVGPNGRPMDDAMYAKLHRSAVACGVSV